LTIFRKITELMKQYGMDDVVLLGGGIIPDEDKPILEQMGVKGLFGPGTSLQRIIEFIREEVQRRRQELTWTGHRDRCGGTMTSFA
jgi:methylmalonyl-CoA mutase, C-terminal domain